jgi:signal transduction histidine kinase
MGSPPVAASPSGPWSFLYQGRTIAGVWFLLVVITVLHYATPAEIHWVHDVARRMYYLPILLGAFLGGIRGGLFAAVLASVLYLPHAFSHMGHMDPAPPLEKFLEVVLYLVIGTVGGVLVDRERSERRRQEELAGQLQGTLDDLRATEQQLIRSGRLGALGELTAGLAHEIKNPLHAMRGTAEILRDAVEQDRPEARMANLQLEEIDRLTGVLDRFLDFARPREAGTVDVDLGVILERVTELAGAQARKAQVELSPEAPTTPAIVRGDPEQLVQLVLGIVLNALDALRDHDGARRVSLSVSSRERGSRHYRVITAANTGPAIPEELLERIFDPFVTTREDGTGLGLSIASRIADTHGGFIEARNVGSSGVEFAIFLPRT